MQNFIVRAGLALLLSLAATGPSNAQSEAISPAQTWLGAGYLHINSGDEGLDDLTGFAIAGSLNPTGQWVFKGAIEHIETAVDPALGDLNLDGTAYVATVGHFWPVTDSVHLTLDLGFDMERITLSTTGASVSDDLWFANLVAGIKAKPHERIEVGASVQWLEAINDAASGESTWVGRADLAVGLGRQFEFITSAFYENDEPGGVVGLRYRW